MHTALLEAAPGLGYSFMVVIDVAKQHRIYLRPSPLIERPFNSLDKQKTYVIDNEKIKYVLNQLSSMLDN
ncbi:hypothetical protein [Cupriavidus oxalaticus]|uniref:Uncharacterized protein n=1 Tax=Cupriavidus oxalaticus TaxID=96344 RepID=A0A4P7L359_9BURK|nr:hypothetical protein [Cupriavidus oxalaticus]QBY49670.1 hypothetical protein E0W60_00015 [Cupriavidus oxalaticus]